MKNTISVIVFMSALLLSASLSRATVGGEITFPCMGEINSDASNLRAGRSLNYEVMTKLDRGARVTVAGFARGWYRVEPPEGVIFWVSSDYLNDGEVTAGRLNVRSRPALSSTVVCQLERGDEVKEVEERGDWTGISAPPCAGLWISSELVDLLPERNGEEDLAEEETGPEAPPPDLGREEDEEAIEEEQPVATGAAKPQAAAQPEAAPEQRPKPCICAGRMEMCEDRVVPGVHHKLVTGFIHKKTVCYAGSKSVNLTFYDGDRVRVWGYEVARLPGGIPVVDVRRLEVE